MAFSCAELCLRELIPAIRRSYPNAFRYIFSSRPYFALTKGSAVVVSRIPGCCPETVDARLILGVDCSLYAEKFQRWREPPYMFSSNSYFYFQSLFSNPTPVFISNSYFNFQLLFPSPTHFSRSIPIFFFILLATLVFKSSCLHASISPAEFLNIFKKPNNIC